MSEAVATRSFSVTGPQWILRDALLMTKRNLIHTFREPQTLVFTSIQPVMFVLLFRYVFGGAIHTGGPYVDYLMPGIFVQTTVFGSMITGMGLSYDLTNGMIERFRSLPMSRSAVLLGRTIADALRNLFTLLLMLAVGVLVGFRIHGGIGEAVAGIALIILYGFAFSWISALIGITIKNPEAVQSAGFIWVFPLTFVSSAFVQTQTMPSWMASFANVNPFTIAVNAARQLFMGSESVQFGLPNDATLNVVSSLLWIAFILVVFIPLAVDRYRKAV